VLDRLLGWLAGHLCLFMPHILQRANENLQFMKLVGYMAGHGGDCWSLPQEMKLIELATVL
jgi:hypothetical protein